MEGVETYRDVLSGGGGLLSYVFEDGEDTRELFGGGEEGGVRTGGLPPYIEDSGAGGDVGLDCLSDGVEVGWAQVAAVGEGIGCDVED